MFFDLFYALCKKNGVSCKKAVTDMGLSNSLPTKWKKTGATPNGETLSKIADYFGVSIDYLLCSNVDDNLCGSSRQDILNEVDIAFYGDYRELSEDDKEMLRAMARTMLERQKQKKKRE